MHNTADRFSTLADSYARSESHANGDDLQIVGDFAASMANEICLDVACGTGNTTFQIAQSARFVIGYDIAPGMIEKASSLAKERQLSNVLFQVGDALAMPFAAKSFSLITCRIAPHHFVDVNRFLREVKRVLVDGGRIVVEDSLAPVEPAAAEFLERIEKWRDPTHVRSLSQAEWKEMLGEDGFVVARDVIYEKRRDFSSWARRSMLSSADVAALTMLILETPIQISQPFFTVDRERGIIQTFVDQKIILRAEKT